jgi:hypothetical protein
MCVLPYLGFYLNVMKTSNVPSVAMAEAVKEFIWADLHLHTFE